MRCITLTSTSYCRGLRRTQIAGQPQPSTSSTGQENQYGYIPTEAVCITFVVLFSISSRKRSRCDRSPICTERRRLYPSLSCLPDDQVPPNVVADPYCSSGRRRRNPWMERTFVVQYKRFQWKCFYYSVRSRRFVDTRAGWLTCVSTR